MCFRCTKADEARGERGKHLRVQVRVCGVVCVRARACVVRLRMGREQCVVGVRALACVSVGESGVGAVHVALVAGRACGTSGGPCQRPTCETSV